MCTFKKGEKGMVFFMNYIIIVRPLIGAIIGYVTNWLAVKMLFRPLKPIKIGKYKLPFTPGIIPKNRERIAISIGNAISDNLLTQEVLEKNLLSREMEDAIKAKLIQILDKLKENDETLKNDICKIVDDESYDKAIKYIKETVKRIILEAVKEANIGNLIAEQIEKTVKEKIFTR